MKILLEINKPADFSNDGYASIISAILHRAFNNKKYKDSRPEGSFTVRLPSSLENQMLQTATMIDNRVSDVEYEAESELRSVERALEERIEIFSH